MLQLRARSVLDLGIGDGRLTEAMLRVCPAIRITGVDFSKYLLEKARRRLERYADRLEFHQFDFVEGIPISQQFDAVLLARTLHHLDSDAILAALRNVARAIQSPHRVMIVERWAFQPRDELQQALRAVRVAIAEVRFPGLGEFHHTERCYARLLRQSGYSAVSIFWHDRVVWPGDYLRRLRHLRQLDACQSSTEILRHSPGEINLPTLVLVASMGGNAHKEAL